MIPAMNLSVRTAIAPTVILTFKSTKNSSTTFGVEYRGADDPIWNDGIGNILQPAKSGFNSVVTFPWTTTAEKSVTISVLDSNAGFGVETFNGTGLTEINMLLASNWVTGITINLSSNPGLTSIVLPNAVNNNLYAQSCSALTSIDFSNVTGNMGNVWAFSCPSLTTLTVPVGFGSAFTWISGTAISGHFDMSNWARIGNTNISNNDSVTSYTAPIEGPSVLYGNFNISGSALLAGTIDLSTMYLTNAMNISTCPNVTAIILPATSQDIYIDVSYTGISTIDHNSMTLYQIQRLDHCNNLTSIDYTGVINNGVSRINIYSNPNLGYVDLTGPTAPFPERNDFDLDAKDNGWSAAIVNHMLVDMNSVSTNAYTGRGIDLGGVNDPNAAPDATSGGYDGLAAVADLVNNKGFVVVTN